jgi:hypothetical protein
MLVLTTFFADKRYEDRDWRGIQQEAEEGKLRTPSFSPSMDFFLWTMNTLIEGGWRD